MPITGAELIQAFKADVEAFFRSDSNFVLKIVDSGWNPPSCKGVGSKARILLPTSYYEKQIETYEELALMIVVLGHETAHFLNRHNEHADESSLETQAIEMWADFYGVKLALVAITFGEDIQRLAESVMVETSMKVRIKLFASVFATLANTYFAISHPTYPPAAVRVATCLAGLLSFFEKIFAFQALLRNDAKEYEISVKPETIVKRALGIQLWIYENAELTKLVNESYTPELYSDQIQLISKIHRGIQSKQKELFEGMKEVPAHWLYLAYDALEKEREINANAKLSKLKDALDSLGFDSSVIDEYKKASLSSLREDNI